MRNSHLKRSALIASACALVGLGIGLGVPAVASSPTAGPALGSNASPFPHMDHVFVIMMENTAYSDLLNPSNPNTTFIRSLASTYGLEANYFGVTHVSLPNYLAVTSGSNWNSNSDDVAQAPLLDHENLVDQLEAAGISWKAYMEDLPFAG